MDKDAYYFPHFCNARNDRKLRRVRKELGVEGYGIYFMVLEVLREQKDFRYPMDDIDLLADEFRTSDQKVRVVICNYDLFQVDEHEQFFSPKFIEYLSPYLKKKQRNRINGIKGNLIKYNHATKEQILQMSDDEILHLNDMIGVSVGGDSGGDRELSQSKVNKSKVKQSKEDNISVTSLEDDVPNASDSETWLASIRIAEHLLDAICEWDDTHKYNANRPSIKEWVKQIDLAIRRDGRNEKQLMDFVDFLFTSDHKVAQFWATNIQSGKKLRDKFDQVKNQLKQEKAHGTTKQNRAQRYIDRAESVLSQLPE